LPPLLDDARRRRSALAVPFGLVRVAAIGVAVFAVLHLLGARESTSVLSGTSPGSGTAAFLGAAYAVAYFGAVVGAPVLVIAALIFCGLARCLPSPRGPGRHAETGAK
jgi:hypothetical protein